MRRTRRATLAALGALSTGCLGAVDGGSTPACPADVAEDTAARIGFVGDVMFGRNVDDRWDDRPPEGVWGDTLDRLDALDGLVLNLECCLSDRGRRRPNRTYYFRADPDWAVPALERAGAGAVALANNHMLDYGPVALRDTVDHLSDAGIANAGAGPDYDTAAAPTTAEFGDLTVCLLSLTDQSSSYAAGSDSPGTAYTPLTSEVTKELLEGPLRRARETDHDLLVASLHWGPNWEVEPSDGQRAMARWLIDQGVDVVHGHSAHVIQGVEVYRGRPIVYDAGDFVDDYVIKSDLHNDRTFLFELVVDDGRLDRLRLVPAEIVDERVTRADPGAAAWLRDRMRTLSDPFGTTLERAGDGLAIPLSCE
jgi:poly-gamma-glutamate synthesis protein (capsule biosynthesis protein)